MTRFSHTVIPCPARVSSNCSARSLGRAHFKCMWAARGTDRRARRDRCFCVTRPGNGGRRRESPWKSTMRTVIRLKAQPSELEGAMTHAGMKPVIVETESLGEGKYATKDFEFTMGGDWVLIVRGHACRRQHRGAAGRSEGRAGRDEDGNEVRQSQGRQLAVAVLRDPTEEAAGPPQPTRYRTLPALEACPHVHAGGAPGSIGPYPL